MATCTYQEEPPWLDYPTVRHAKRWPSLDLVVKWFNNHSLALGFLRQEQRLAHPSGRSLNLILPGTTRWTSHFLCISRLLELEECLRVLPISSANQEILKRAAGSKRDAKAKADEVIKTILDLEFWPKLRRLYDILRPLAIASNVTQGDNARLDTVLLTLAYLFYTYSTLPEKESIRNAILASLEKRWANADQAIFILAVILNPYIRARAFHPNSIYKTAAGLRSLVYDAFRRFYEEEPDYDMDNALNDYITWTGEWSADGMNLSRARDAAKSQRVGVNLVQLWRGHDTGLKNGRDGLVKLAMRVLSMVPNSAATERIFSTFRSIHTDHRNRLDPEKVRRMTIVNADTQARYGAPPQPRRKRRYGDDDGEHGPLATTPAIPPASSALHPPPSTSTHTPTPSLPASPRSDTDFPLDPSLRHASDEVPPSTALEEAADDDFPTLAQLLRETEDSDASQSVPSTDRSLQNLFQYPSQDDPSPPSLGFMTEFWQHGEVGLDAEKGFHEMCSEMSPEFV